MNPSIEDLIKNPVYFVCHNTQLIEEKISRETPVKWARIACIYGVYVQQVVGYFDARNARFPRLSWIFKIRVTV